MSGKRERQAKLSLASVTKVFPAPGGGSLTVLDDVSFDVSANEFVSVIGASGSGKTTLLRVIDHLIPPTSGRVLIDGVEVTQPGQELGFVFQKDALWPWRTVLENVTYGLERRSVGKEQRRQIARRFLSLVGLGGFEDYYPHQLSGGMRQRVNLARALCIEPDVLLMDEPFAALDAQTREMMQVELLRILQSTEATIVFVTHQIDEAVFLSDRVITLSSRPGRVKSITTIDLPRPRELDAKRGNEFQNYVKTLWGEIHDDVEASFHAVP